MVFWPAASGVGQKAQHLQLVAIGGRSLPPPMEVEPPPLPAMPKSVPTALPPLDTRNAAVAELMRLICSEWGGGSLQFRRVASAYRELVKTRGAPAMSDKLLSQEIKKYGCKSHTGRRQKDGSRPTIVVFPVKFRRRSAT